MASEDVWRFTADETKPDEKRSLKRARPSSAPLAESTIPAWRNGRALLPSPTGAASLVSPPASCALLRLHEEVLDFAAFASPTPDEAAIAARALGAVQAELVRLFPRARIEVFGSRANGLVLPTSDWDLALFNVPPTPQNMRRIASEFEARGLASRTDVIESARVPIVKLWEARSGIQVDISFDARSALVSRALIGEYLARFPALRPLLLVLKYFLVQRGLNDTYSGGAGSFLLVLMVVHVLQQRLASASLLTPAGGKRRGGGGGGGGGGGAVDNALNLGSLLVSFLELYGYNLNMTTTGISVRGASGGYFSKAERRWFNPQRPSLLAMENPCDPETDAGKNSWGMDRVRRAFRHAHTNLSQTLRAWAQGGHGASSKGKGAPLASILAAIISPDQLLVDRHEELLSGPGPQLSAAPAVADEGDEQKPAPATLSEGRTLRRPRLIADLATRKERGVRDIAPEGWL
jgi:non-canonical poly(A) RNA polymerase PAPD5/7